MHLAAVTMQKNEDQCLMPWAKYHGYLFGFENILILDHGSTSRRTVTNLEILQSLGVHVERLPATAELKDKGRIVASGMAKFSAADFVFPIDCDEFLFCKAEDANPTCSRNIMLDHLSSLKNRTGKFQISENYLHVLGHPGYFWSQPYQKVFFKGGDCLSLDLGSHVGASRTGDEVHQSQLVYAHFHFKPYRINRELTREKLRTRVDLDDLEAVKAFKGPGAHLLQHHLCSEAEYYQTLQINNKAIYFNELVNLFELLGIDPNFSMAGEALPSRQLTSEAEGPNFARHLATVNAVENTRFAGFEGGCRSRAGDFGTGLLVAPQSPTRPDNISRGKRAMQSSHCEWSFAPTPEQDAAGAVNGVLDGTRKFHTDLEDNPWWQVDLGGIATITEIHIHNARDHTQERFRDFSLSVSIDGSSWVELAEKRDDVPLAEPYIWAGPGTAWARYVRVTLLGRNYLHLDQVEVFGRLP